MTSVLQKPLLARDWKRSVDSAHLDLHLAGSAPQRRRQASVRWLIDGISLALCLSHPSVFPAGVPPDASKVSGNPPGPSFDRGCAVRSSRADRPEPLAERLSRSLEFLHFLLQFHWPFEM
jgi:hypothetical protein